MIDSIELDGETFRAMQAKLQLYGSLIDEIDHLTGDDFCEEFSMELALTEREKVARKKLSMIYRLAHGYNERNKCYHVHEDWRALLLESEPKEKAPVAWATRYGRRLWSRT